MTARASGEQALPTTPVIHTVGSREPTGMVRRPDVRGPELEIHCDRTINQATCRVSLTSDTINAVSQAAHETISGSPSWKNATNRRSHDTKEKKMDGRMDQATICGVPPAGFEPAHTAPEDSCLSRVLAGRKPA
ncbi:hypothetical protein O7599_11295 [Streptomyces sp. WMMC500]|uniref:hypothetical protein n=1 Tax=Streptomyces sp. WMMC500 TaxID=3015154 RepID=UPI00248CDC09|nr:hypothetical protein [Streptomyces sp. WMMC500]WBB63067.1 hypothetical protein O7599_11295 [Streptomyces sp. WMMC500]